MGGKRWRSKARGDAEAQGARRTRGEVGIAVRGGIVGAVEEVFDVELGAQVGVEPVEERGVEADEAREADRVVGGREEFVAVEGAEAEAPPGVAVVAIPEGEGVARELGEAGATIIATALTYIVPS